MDNMTKFRIIERIYSLGNKTYIIQKKHFLFRWKWINIFESDCWEKFQDAQKENGCLKELS